MKASVGMGVTVTLVFADEAHREAWLVEEGIISAEPPPKDGVGLFIVEEKDKAVRQRQMHRIDFDHRKRNTDLVYSIGPVMSARPRRGPAAVQIGNGNVMNIRRHK